MSERIRRRVWHLYPVFILACLLHSFSEWSYSAASWLYECCGTTIFEASITWED
jgi:hypothetical protein